MFRLTLNKINIFKNKIGLNKPNGVSTLNKNSNKFLNDLSGFNNIKQHTYTYKELYKNKSILEAKEGQDLNMIQKAANDVKVSFCMSHGRLILGDIHKNNIKLFDEIIELGCMHKYTKNNFYLASRSIKGEIEHPSICIEKDGYLLSISKTHGRVSYYYYYDGRFVETIPINKGEGVNLAEIISWFKLRKGESLSSNGYLFDISSNKSLFAAYGPQSVAEAKYWIEVIENHTKNLTLADIINKKNEKMLNITQLVQHKYTTLPYAYCMIYEDFKAGRINEVQWLRFEHYYKEKTSELGIPDFSDELKKGF